MTRPVRGSRLPTRWTSGVRSTLPGEGGGARGPRAPGSWRCPTHAHGEAAWEPEHVPDRLEGRHARDTTRAVSTS